MLFLDKKGKFMTMENSLIDVTHYSKELIQLHHDAVQVQVTYHQVWNDGFGARGWKLNSTIGDPTIIASTRDTGVKINTSVFIHDILDHFLSGFGVSGHRNEAMALAQLSKRTGSSPFADYKQMVTEDILDGQVNGETLFSFLPKKLRTLLPVNTKLSNKETLLFLQTTMGKIPLEDALIEHFFTLGRSGEDHAIKSWKKLGLDPKKQTDIGLALQNILNHVDKMAETEKVLTLEGSICINNTQCILSLKNKTLSKTIFTANVSS
jgi:hypothetical protein